jgi:hypothetical protein
MNARRSSAALLAASFLLAAAPAMAETGSGAALRQNALTVGWPIRPSGIPLPEGAIGLSETRMRTWLNHSWDGLPWGETRLNAALELTSSFNSAGGAALGIIGSTSPAQSRPFEVVDLSWEPTGATGASTRARIERLDLAWSMGAFDFDLGRQPISLGTSHFVGVLDVLAPFAPGAMDASYKPGIDALRARTPLGDTGEAELILAGREPFETGGAIARMRTSLAGMDLELLGGRFRNRGFGGLGWEGELGPAGLWGEVALFQRRPEAEQYRGGWSRAAFSGVVGADFNLPFETRGGAAVMVQDFGARSPQEVASVYTDAPFREGWAFLGSAGYGVLTASKQLHPLVNGSLAGLVNLVDGSTLWQPRLMFSISDNSDLGAYAWLGMGAPPRLEGERVTPGSEFGMVPTGVGLYARWFF